MTRWRGRGSPGRIVVAATILATAGELLAAGSAAAQDDEPGFLEPPPSLPQTLGGSVRLGNGSRPEGRIDRLRDLFPALAACWAPPQGLAGLERLEMTVRLSLRRDGSLFGQPRVTFATVGPETRARQLLRDSTLDAIRNCTPLAVTPSLGGAIAGRPIAVRFIYEGPKGRGV